MECTNIGFIGIGNMASAIIGGILSAKFIPAENIYMYNPHSEKMEHFAELGCKPCIDLSEIVDKCRIIFLCIKPQIFPEVLEKMKPSVTNQKVNRVLFVSIAAGITAQNIRDALAVDVEIIRAMPNTPLLLNQGATALCRTENVAQHDFDYVSAVFGCCGLVRAISESAMNAIIPISGSSPAYLYLLAKLSSDYAQQHGIDSQVALEMFCQTMIGSADMLLHSGKDPQALIDMVTSKGGATFALLDVLHQNAFSQILTQSFEACEHRAEALSM